MAQWAAGFKTPPTLSELWEPDLTEGAVRKWNRCKHMNRASGILLPVSSLPSKYGIGCFSREAYDFIDKLKEAGQSYWQILPLSPTSYGDSPYQSFSSFAGNPYFIDLEALVEDGMLTEEECESCDFGSDPIHIDYEKLYLNRFVWPMSAAIFHVIRILSVLWKRMPHGWMIMLFSWL